MTGGVPALDGVTGAPIALIAFILAVGAAALRYLVTEELLVRAGKVPETPVSTTLFFVGFLAIFLLDMLPLIPFVVSQYRWFAGPSRRTTAKQLR